MILNNQIVSRIASKSGLNFDKAKDYDILCDLIFSDTGRMIGVNTIKRLMGYLVDDRKTNDYTLNTVAIYLGFTSWDELCNSFRVNSEWSFDDETVYIQDLKVGTHVIIHYLNRKVKFEVLLFNGLNALKVLELENSSLKEGDILLISHIRKGEKLVAKSVYRGDEVGNYRTNGEVKDIQIINEI